MSLETDSQQPSPMGGLDQPRPARGQGFDAQRSLSEIIALLDRIEFKQGLCDITDPEARGRREQDVALFALARRGLHEVSKNLRPSAVRRSRSPEPPTF